LIAMLCKVTSDLDKPITQQSLCDWQAAIFPEPSLSKKLIIGELRGDAPMQVVSRKRNHEVVHFQAPPTSELQKELNAFISWFNLKQPLEMHGIVRAAIAHLWLITIHPFDDGNGRVTRALTDRALAQDEKTSIRFYSLSAAIEQNRSSYYEILENIQGCKTKIQEKCETDITDWINWFLDVLANAMQQGQQRVARVINKSHFWQTHSQTILTARQNKVLNRLLDSAGEEFLQGINASKYKNLADVSKATATRDLTELVSKGCLTQLPGGGRSTRYAIKY
ncbi:Fic domain protein, PA0574 type, partial [hydrothermal vent metagenome]